MEEDIDDLLYEKLISENLDKFYQVKLVISTFRDKRYLSLRKYFLSFDEGYVPSREGISMEYEMVSSTNLLEGLLEVIPIEECKDLLLKKLEEK